MSSGTLDLATHRSYETSILSFSRMPSKRIFLSDPRLADISCDAPYFRYLPCSSSRQENRAHSWRSSRNRPEQHSVAGDAALHLDLDFRPRCEGSGRNAGPGIRPRARGPAVLRRRQRDSTSATSPTNRDAKRRRYATCCFKRRRHRYAPRWQSGNRRPIASEC